MPSSAPDVATEVDVGERLRAIRRLRRCTLQDGRRALGAERELPQPGRARPVEREHRVAAADRRRARRQRLRPVRADRAAARRGCFAATTAPRSNFGVLGRKLLLTPKPLHHLEVFVGELEPGRIDRDRAVRPRRLGGALRRPAGDGPARARRRAPRARAGRQHRLPELDAAPHLEHRGRDRGSDVDHQPAQLLEREEERDGHRAGMRSGGSAARTSSSGRRSPAAPGWSRAGRASRTRCAHSTWPRAAACR